MARIQGNSLDFNNASRILNLPAPASANEPARLADLNSAVEGLAWKDSARVATQANISIASPGATIDGVTMAAGDRVLVRAQTTGSENGIYIWNGAAVAMTRVLDADTANELEAATITVEEGTSAGVTYRQTLVNFTLGTGSPAFVTFGTSTPVASTSQQGTVQIATQTDVDTGTDALKPVTPATLTNWANRIRKFAQTFGDGSATSFTITHNLNTKDLQVTVYSVGSTFDEVNCDVQHTTVNSITLVFAAAPSASQFRVVILG